MGQPWKNWISQHHKETNTFALIDDILVRIMCESATITGKADKKAAVKFMLIEIKWLWSRVNSMFSDKKVARHQGTFKQGFPWLSKTALQLFLKIKSYNFSFTCLASSKQISGPFLYLGCLTISHGFGPSSVSLVKECLCFSYIVHEEDQHFIFIFKAGEKIYANSDSAEININIHSSLFKFKKTNPTI